MSCFCGSKNKKNKRYLHHINELFEQGNVKLSVLIADNGTIKESYYREDLSPEDLEVLLGKILNAKATWSALSELSPKQHMHIQGSHFGISLYPSTVGLFILMLELNPHLHEAMCIDKLQPRIQDVLETITRRK